MDAEELQREHDRLFIQNINLAVECQRLRSALCEVAFAKVTSKDGVRLKDMANIALGYGRLAGTRAEADMWLQQREDRRRERQLTRMRAAILGRS